MTPEARIAAAADILDVYLGGTAAEKALLAWARSSRFAGSKDRRAVRDHVFQALRCLRSHAALGGGMTGRSVMIGALRAEGRDPAEVFTGQGHAPAPLSAEELSGGRAPEDGAEAFDFPEWLWAELRAGLGERAEAEADVLRRRAPVFLRVNARKSTRAEVIKALQDEGIEAQISDLASWALEVKAGAQKIKQSLAYESGLVELQDAASQAVAEMLPLEGASHILDYCAGGGGKALAIAALSDAEVSAHDISVQRMKDIPARAARAGVTIRLAERLIAEDQFDLVFCDAPCSGSGAWRRAPEGKWRLTQETLAELTKTQADVLQKAAQHVAAGGVLAYATCSLLARENEEIVASFLEAHPGWSCDTQRQWLPSEGADGFFCAVLRQT